MLSLEPMMRREVGGVPLSEFARKGIHVATAVVPLYLGVTGHRLFVIALYALMTVGMVAIEIVRRSRHPSRMLWDSWVGAILRQHESNALLGATWYGIASLLTVLLFPIPTAVLTLLFLAFGDTAASFAGRAWGRHRPFGRKSIEGAVAFCLVCWITVFVAWGWNPSYPLHAGLAAGVVAGAAELAFDRWDDNWVVPLATAPTMQWFIWLGY